MNALGPADFRRQRHQDRLDIAAGHQAELGAAVVQQVEFDIAAAAHELVFALCGGPGLVHVGAHDARIGVEEGLADGAGDFAKAVGLEFDASAGGLGIRSRRYSMLVEDGVVKVLNIEESPGKADLSGAAHLLAQV